MEQNMDNEITFGLMVINMRVNGEVLGQEELRKAMVLLLGRMDLFTLVNFQERDQVKMENMERVKQYLLMGEVLKVDGQMTYRQMAY